MVIHCPEICLSRLEKIHGLKVLTVMLANGIQAVYGPISARRNDIDCTQSSGLDNYLSELQQGQEHKYCVFGDGIFRALDHADTTIRSYNRPAANAPLTEIQEHENVIMRKVRVEIEHGYGDVTNLFGIVESKHEWKLMNTNSCPEKRCASFSSCTTAMSAVERTLLRSNSIVSLHL